MCHRCTSIRVKVAGDVVALLALRAIDCRVQRSFHGRFFCGDIIANPDSISAFGKIDEPGQHDCGGKKHKQG